MKKFIVLSLLLFLTFAAGRACCYVPTTNYYIYKIVPDDRQRPSLYDAVARNWANYCGGISMEDANGALEELTRLSPSDFGKSENTLLEAARSRKDYDALAYLRSLVDYLHASSKLSPAGWDYPTKNEVAAARQTLERLSRPQTKVGRWGGEYHLLRARCAFALGRYADVVRLWDTRPKDEEAAWMPIFRNLYAGALVRSGRSPEAIRIYADQNDSESLRFLVYKLRNLRGIRQEYASDANSPLLPYLVEDFVSNVQETYDNTADTAYLSVIDRARVLQREQQDFIAFAQKVVAEKRSKSLAMWQSAIAMMYYYSGQYAQADQAAEAALSLSGTPMMRTNARDVRVFTSLAHRGVTDATLNAIVPDLRRWEEDTENGHGRNLHTRLVRQDLIPALEKARRPFDALLAQRSEFYDSTLINMDSGRGYDPNLIYGSSYFDAIDRLSADSLKAYYTYLHSPAREAWQKLWKPTSFAGKEFYYDLMGTRLLRECRFAEAIPYLEKTSLTFLASQNIAIYAALRDYKVERWYRRQPVHDYDPEMEYNIEENSKLKFCQDVLRLQSQLKAADDAALRQRIAYRLASYLAQASAAGDCWYLSRYGISALSSDVYEDDLGTDRFRGDALQRLSIHYLDLAAGATDRNLRERALVGLAWLPDDPAHIDRYDNTSHRRIYRKQSRQFKAYMKLAAWRATGHASAYVNHCDILTRFARDNYRQAVRPPRQENDLFSWLPLYDLPIRSF